MTVTHSCRALYNYVYSILTSSLGICILVVFFRCYVTFVLRCHHVVFTLYVYIVLEKYQSRLTIFKSMLEQLRKMFRNTTIAMEIR